MGLGISGSLISECGVNNQLDCLNNIGGLLSFERKIKGVGLYPLKGTGLSVLQVNVGKVCNLACKHCHVGAGPDRKELMGKETFLHCLQAMADEAELQTLDITGGAPELNPYLPWFIKEAAGLGRKIKVRSNLTVLEQEENAYLAEFFASHRVEVVASLPYYQGKKVDIQRGKGVFDASVRVIRRLNELGYGQEGTQLELSLVYNPGGAFLPPAQHAMEADYRRELLRRYGITFNRLLTITNVPLGRFLEFLIQSENLTGYMGRLVGVFNPAAAARVMCRSQISVGWDGRLYDCDFNQMLGLGCCPEVPGHIKDFRPGALQNRRIAVGNHCYACTAGAGSSCGGAMAEPGKS